VLKLLLALICSFYLLPGSAQKNYGVSQDYYIYKNNRNSIVPLVYYETKNHWYSAARYNYEEDQTLSLQLGKKFSKHGIVSYSITPLAGWLSGKFNGMSIGTQAQMDAGKFSLSTEPEYCVQFNHPSTRFFYSWSELTIQASPLFYTGLALQATRENEKNLTADPGFVLAFSFKNFEIPLYFFKPSSLHYFITGIHWRLIK
jgi:hypothetical protein